MTYLLSPQTIEDARLSLQALGQKYGLDFRLGYIGNLERTGDYRHWQLWVQGVVSENGNTLAIGLGSTEEVLDQVTEVLNEGGIENLIARTHAQGRISYRDITKLILEGNQFVSYVVQDREDVEAAVEALADRVVEQRIMDFYGEVI